MAGELTPTGVLAAAERRAGHLSERRLVEVAHQLSERYRGPAPAAAGGMSRDEVAAYCVYRFPATYAAAAAALSALRRSCPALRPRRLVDLGGGPGAAAIAACAAFPDVEQVTVVDSDGEMLRAGAEIAAALPGALPPATTWRRADLAAGGRQDLPPADLVIGGYLLGELPSGGAGTLVEALTRSAAGGTAVVLVEPGTPAGHARVLEARARLVSAGQRVAAPCPHDEPCPMPADDWCHFSVRIPRTRLHRIAKGADLGWEDEKFSYVATAGPAVPVGPAGGRLVRHPEWRKSLVTLQVCAAPPAIETRAVPRSAGALYRAARAARWGDPWPPAPPEPPAPGGPAAADQLPKSQPSPES